MLFSTHINFWNSRIFRKRVSVTSCHRSLQKNGVQILKDQEKWWRACFPEFSETHFSTSQMPKKSQKHRFALKVAKLPEGPPWRYLREECFRTMEDGMQKRDFNNASILKHPRIHICGMDRWVRRYKHKRINWTVHGVARRRVSKHFGIAFRAMPLTFLKKKRSSSDGCAFMSH